MGGDYAPAIVLEGLAKALKEHKDIKILLVGHLEKLAYYLEKYKLVNHPQIELIHAEQVVEMKDPSIIALKTKKNSSITVAAKLVKQGKADAILSAGHTGATVAATKILIRTLPGIERPAISAIMPSYGGNFILADAGANTDCKARYLAQFAILGETYSRFTFNIARPRIGLLSIGGEDSKGNDLTKETFKMLSKMPINFIGNIEGTDVFQSVADVVVCDGFVGNVLLKSTEGFAKATFNWMKDVFTQNTLRKTGAILAKNAFKDLKQIGDSEEYGGGLLLGLNAVCIKVHGSGSSKAIYNAIRVLIETNKFKFNEQITARLHECEEFIKKNDDNI
jgi:glycerol-3-phosphate acyltransferase PlsX